jgi:hypothetical protein
MGVVLPFELGGVVPVFWGVVVPRLVVPEGIVEGMGELPHIAWQSAMPALMPCCIPELLAAFTPVVKL